MQESEKIKMDVILTFEADNDDPETINIPELIPFVPVQINKNKEIDFSKLVQEIKEMGFDLDNNLISYWSQSSQMYVFCGREPLPQRITILNEDYNQNGKLELVIKCKKIKKNPLHQLMNCDEEEFNKFNTQTHCECDKDNDEDFSPKETKCRRTKERKIGYIIKKVLKWRQLYNGVLNQSGSQSRCSLEESAQKVGISKKSLDDYLLQIRFGKKYGFNFNEHYRDKVGVLRAFVKKKKTENEGIKKENTKIEEKTKKIRKKKN